MRRTNEILILGLGNEVLGNESLGIDIVKKLEIQDNYPLTDYQFSYIGGLELLEFIQDYSILVLIDTIETSDGTEGRVRLMKKGDHRETMHLSSPHDMSFETACSLGKKLGFSIPENIMIIAVEIIPDLVLSNKLSRNITENYKDILAEIKKYIEQFVNTANTCSLNKEP
jgi:hydrogenase maturation protease